jgi:Fic family protein
MNIFISIIGGVVVGLIIGFFVWHPSTSAQADESDSLIHQKEAEKAANLEKVRGLISTQNKITNDDVQNLLNVSDATAERYLDDLESAGIIRQVGKTGVNIYYEKT